MARPVRISGGDLAGVTLEVSRRGRLSAILGRFLSARRRGRTGVVRLPGAEREAERPRLRRAA
jgi:hypothetical protein